MRLISKEIIVSGRRFFAVADRALHFGLNELFYKLNIIFHLDFLKEIEMHGNL